MRTFRRLSFAAATAALAACTAAETEPADSAAAPATAADPTVATAGGGVPSGYVGTLDPGSDDDIGQVSYAVADGRWTVRTGPAHVVVAPSDSASGTYTATATFEQMERPSHPEAFGLVIGAAGMEAGGAQRYTYFIVRHTGEAMVRVREGDSTRTVMGWTANPNVPQADSAGRATYALAAEVGADSVRFLVNGQPVTTVARSAVPTDGLAGVRINHNLHLTVTPVRIERR